MDSTQSEEQEISGFLTDLEKAGIKVTNQEGAIAWLKDKMAKGFDLKEIKQNLKDNDYDFKKVNQILEDKLMSKTAIKKVEDLENKIEGEEQKKKDQSRLSLIAAAFMISIVSAGSSWFISLQVKDIDTSILGETGGILTTFIKAGWVIGIAAGFVGLLLATMMISEKMNNKKLVPTKE